MTHQFNISNNIFEITEGNLVKYESEALVIPAKIDFSYGYEGLQDAILKASGETPFKEAIKTTKENKI
ncbi:MAG: hypothetical protein KC550_01320 [Nanoarchaeota archaeon]|nr:hypothetical protein [Nanoarchaeota archaeon]